MHRAGQTKIQSQRFATMNNEYIRANHITKQQLDASRAAYFQLMENLGYSTSSGITRGGETPRTINQSVCEYKVGKILTQLSISRSPIQRGICDYWRNGFHVNDLPTRDRVVETKSPSYYWSLHALLSLGIDTFFYTDLILQPVNDSCVF